MSKSSTKSAGNNQFSQSAAGLSLVHGILAFFLFFLIRSNFYFLFPCLIAVATWPVWFVIVGSSARSDVFSWVVLILGLACWIFPAFVFLMSLLH